jgi:DNA replication protein DnaC
LHPQRAQELLSTALLLIIDDLGMHKATADAADAAVQNRLPQHG